MRWLASSKKIYTQSSSLYRLRPPPFAPLKAAAGEAVATVSTYIRAYVRTYIHTSTIYFVLYVATGIA